MLWKSITTFKPKEHPIFSRQKIKKNINLVAGVVILFYYSRKSFCRRVLSFVVRQTPPEEWNAAISLYNHDNHQCVRRARHLYVEHIELHTPKKIYISTQRSVARRSIVNSLGSGPFYSSQYHLSRYPIDRDSPRDRDTPRLRYWTFLLVAISSFAISHWSR